MKNSGISIVATPAAIAAIVFGVLLGGCTSLVYSPYMHLPAAPMTEGAVSIIGGGEGLPETNSAMISASGEGMLAYAVSDQFTIRGGTWSRVGDIRSGEVDGTSLDAIIALTDRRMDDSEVPATSILSKPSDNPMYARYDFAIVPRAMSLYGTNTLGLAGTLSAAMWMPSFWALRPYIAIGGIVGTGYTSGNNGASGHGYGMMNNIGVTTTFDPHFSINAEIANPIVWTTMTNAVTWYLTPSITMSYAF